MVTCLRRTMWLVCLLAGMMAAAGACTAVVKRPPRPAPRMEVRAAKPRPQAVWVKGHWTWRARARRWVWIPGHWR